MSDEEENPVTTGLVALVAVAIVVGVLAGIAVLMGTRMLGLTGGGGGSSEPQGAASMYMPDPVPTQQASGPEITLLPTDTTPKPQASDKQSSKPSASATTSATQGGARLVLNASPLSATAGEQIMLSGTYLNGEGSVLDIYQKVGADGTWTEFNVKVYVSGGVFQTYVQTWKAGDVFWKVVDPGNKTESSAVRVTYE